MVTKEIKMTKSTPTQFRLSDHQRVFLSQIGDGNMTQGLEECMKLAGYTKDDVKSTITIFKKVQNGLSTYSDKDSTVSLVRQLKHETEAITKIGKENYYKHKVITALLPIYYNKDQNFIVEVIDYKTNKIIYSLII